MSHLQLYSVSSPCETEAFLHSIRLSDQGLCAGRTVIYRHTAPRADLGWLEASLAVAFQSRLAKEQIDAVRAAIDVSKRGGQALANIRLALAGLSRIPVSLSLPARLEMTETLYGNGFSVDELLPALGLHEEA